MRTLRFSLLILSFCNLAFACPELTGEYICKADAEDAQPEKIKLGQEFVEDTTIYRVTDDEGTIFYPANNHPYAFSNSEMSGTIRYSCEDNAFTIYTDAQILSNGVALGKFQMVRSFSIDPLAQVTRNTSAQQTINGEAQSFTETKRCIRQ